MATALHDLLFEKYMDYQKASGQRKTLKEFSENICIGQVHLNRLMNERRKAGDKTIRKDGFAIVMGKGRLERRVEFGPRTGQAIWKYLASRGQVQPRDSFLISRTGKHMDRDELSKRLHSMGLRAVVAKCHPHRFRHTFAVMFLRNGGNALALQRLLGHSTMEMVRRYVKLSEVDLQQAHRRASQVENMRL